MLINYSLAVSFLYNHCNILIIKVTKQSESKLLTSSLLVGALSREWVPASVKLTNPGQDNDNENFIDLPHPLLSRIKIDLICSKVAFV